MASEDCAMQLFTAAQSASNDYALLVNEATQLALQLDPATNTVSCAAQNPALATQQWAFTRDDQLYNAVAGDGMVLALVNRAFTMAPDDDHDSAQKFEQLCPLDFCYLRNSWTGRFLTADANRGVTWQLKSASLDMFQQWGISADGFLINHATALVLQAASASPQAGAALTLGDAVAVGTGDAYQRFDFFQMDGRVRSRANQGLVIGQQDTKAVLLATAPTDFSQIAEFISPYQFFGLQNFATINDSQPWVSRQGKTAYVSSQPEGGLYTVSRYGEIVSDVDGFVLQSAGPNASPIFVDPAPDPIGYDTTTFMWTPAQGGPRAGYGLVQQRTTGTTLMVLAGHMGPTLLMMDGGAGPNWYWNLVGPAHGVFAQYQDIAKDFFANPCPLPDEQRIRAPVDPATVALTSELDKTPRVIITLVTGLLDIFGGISVGDVADSAVTSVARTVLGDAGTAAKVAVVMQGTVTTASIIAVADGITKAGLWGKIFDAILPSSFWGWALTIAKLAWNIATAVLAPYLAGAIKGAKIAFLVAEIILILGGGAADEAALIHAHADRLRSKSRQPELSPA